MITLDSFSSLGEAPRALVQDVLGGRAPHAVLITGIAGTGKRTLARLLACALLCVGEGQRPCMQCKGCRRVLAGTHPDLLTPSCTDKDRTIKVDHLREVLRALSFHALEGRRVILLENAQRMTVQAQNALLKSLEEPDGETHFILTASGETGILPTVRSRCRVVRMPPWPRERLEAELLARQADADKAREIAALCGGSLGAALDMLQNPAFFALHELCERTFFFRAWGAGCAGVVVFAEGQKGRCGRAIIAFIPKGAGIPAIRHARGRIAPARAGGCLPGMVGACRPGAHRARACGRAGGAQAARRQRILARDC